MPFSGCTLLNTADSLTSSGTDSHAILNYVNIGRYLFCVILYARVRSDDTLITTLTPGHRKLTEFIQYKSMTKQLHSINICGM